MKHAILSPSGSDGWIHCSHWAGGGSSSEYSREGTAAHALASWCFEHNADDPLDYCRATGHETIEVEGHHYAVSNEMVEAVRVFVRYVRSWMVEHAVLVHDLSVPIGHITGEEGATGSLDAAVLLPSGNIIVVDFKYGKGVPVDAKDNSQLRLYAAGAIEMLADMLPAAPHWVTYAIVQPRKDSITSEEVPVASLLQWCRDVAAKAAARHVSRDPVNAPRATPGDHCKWCTRKTACAEYRNRVTATVFDATPATPADFDALAPVDPKIGVPDAMPHEVWLASALSKADMIEEWVRAIRAEVEGLLVAGKTVPGYKLVRGKLGDRQWADEAKAEETITKLWKLREDQAYTRKLKSPAQVEKLVKAGSIDPKQWDAIQGLVHRAPGKLSVAPVGDPRPAVSIAAQAEDFEAVGDDHDLS